MKMGLKADEEIEVRLATKEDIHLILSLQEANLYYNTSLEERELYGFVRGQSTARFLEESVCTNSILVAFVHNKFAGYLLTTTVEGVKNFVTLSEMLEKVKFSYIEGKIFNKHSYNVLVQVCIEKKYRRRQILGRLLWTASFHFQDIYTFGISQISNSNVASIKAHIERYGAEKVYEYDCFDIGSVTKKTVIIFNYRKFLTSHILVA